MRATSHGRGSLQKKLRRRSINKPTLRQYNNGTINLQYLSLPSTTPCQKYKTHLVRNQTLPTLPQAAAGSVVDRPPFLPSPPRAKSPKKGRSRVQSMQFHCIENARKVYTKNNQQQHTLSLLRPNRRNTRSDQTKPIPKPTAQTSRTIGRSSDRLKFTRCRMFHPHHLLKANNLEKVDLR